MASLQYYFSFQSLGYNLQEDLKKLGKDPATFNVYANPVPVSAYPVSLLSNFFGLIGGIPFKFSFGQRFEVGHKVSFTFGKDEELDSYFIKAMDTFLEQFSGAYPKCTREVLEGILDEFLDFLLVHNMSWDIDSWHEATCTIHLKIDCSHYV